MKIANLTGLDWKVIDINGSPVIISGKWIILPGSGESGSGQGGLGGQGGSVMPGEGEGGFPVPGQPSEGEPQPGCDGEPSTFPGEFPGESPGELEPAGDSPMPGQAQITDFVEPEIEPEIEESMTKRIADAKRKANGHKSMIKSRKREDEPKEGTESLFDSLESLRKREELEYGDGGQEVGAKSADEGVVNKNMRELLRQFLSSLDDPFRKARGSRLWDAQKVIESVMFRPHRLPYSKFSHPKATETVLFVDVSGSVKDHADFIINLILTACQENFKIVVGSEAHPIKTIETRSFLRTGKDWSEAKSTWERKDRAILDDFTEPFDVALQKFFERNRVAHGSTIIVWGDYEGFWNIRYRGSEENFPKIARMLKNYHVVFLCSSTEKGGHSDAIKLAKMSKKYNWRFIWDIKDEKSVHTALKRLKMGYN